MFAPDASRSGAARIAILPFENLGPAEEAYFADGVTDEVRSKLASLPQLTVISRNSTTGYKGTSKSPQVIAKELGVSYLLSGTVRWQKGASGASRIRVAPELAEISGAGMPVTRWQDSFDAVVEGERGVALLPMSRDGYAGPYIQHQLVRIYMILGEKEKALDLLEPLLKVPYYLSPAWLAIDPDFAPLKGHPCFEALLRKTM